MACLLKLMTPPEAAVACLRSPSSTLCPLLEIAAWIASLLAICLWNSSTRMSTELLLSFRRSHPRLA